MFLDMEKKANERIRGTDRFFIEHQLKTVIHFVVENEEAYLTPSNYKK